MVLKKVFVLFPLKKKKSHFNFLLLNLNSHMMGRTKEYTMVLMITCDVYTCFCSLSGQCTAHLAARAHGKT
jgi:hypothetical protein